MSIARLIVYSTAILIAGILALLPLAGFALMVTK